MKVAKTIRDLTLLKNEVGQFLLPMSLVNQYAKILEGLLREEGDPDPALNMYRAPMSNYFGGDIMVCEDFEDVASIGYIYDWVSFKDGWYEVGVMTNNSGGNTYLVPAGFFSDENKLAQYLDELDPRLTLTQLQQSEPAKGESLTLGQMLREALQRQEGTKQVLSNKLQMTDNFAEAVNKLVFDSSYDISNPEDLSLMLDTLTVMRRCNNAFWKIQSLVEEYGS
jgi:hypothetical protein